MFSSFFPLFHVVRVLSSANGSTLGVSSPKTAGVHLDITTVLILTVSDRVKKKRGGGEILESEGP